MMVGVVHVGHVWMAVPHRHVLMPMCMWLARRITWSVGVLVVGIVHMAMGVLHRFVLMLMLVMLCEMQPDSESHEQSGRHDLQSQRLTE